MTPFLFLLPACRRRRRRRARYAAALRSTVTGARGGEQKRGPLLHMLSNDPGPFEIGPLVFTSGVNVL